MDIESTLLSLKCIFEYNICIERVVTTNAMITEIHTSGVNGVNVIHFLDLRPGLVVAKVMGTMIYVLEKSTAFSLSIFRVRAQIAMSALFQGI